MIVRMIRFVQKIKLMTDLSSSVHSLLDQHQSMIEPNLSIYSNLENWWSDLWGAISVRATFVLKIAGAIFILLAISTVIIIAIYYVIKARSKRTLPVIYSTIDQMLIDDATSTDSIRNLPEPARAVVKANRSIVRQC